MVSNKGGSMSQQPDTRMLDLFGSMFDPFGVWRAALQGETHPYVKLTAELLKAQAEMSSKVIDAYLAAFQPLQGRVETTSAPVMPQLNLVTRAELAAVEERLSRIEQEINHGGPLETIKQALFKGDSSS